MQRHNVLFELRNEKKKRLTRINFTIILSQTSCVYFVKEYMYQVKSVQFHYYNSLEYNDKRHNWGAGDEI